MSRDPYPLALLSHKDLQPTSHTGSMGPGSALRFAREDTEGASKPYPTLSSRTDAYKQKFKNISYQAVLLHNEKRTRKFISAACYIRQLNVPNGIIFELLL